MEESKILDSNSQNSRSYSSLKFGCHTPVTPTFANLPVHLPFLKAYAACSEGGFELKFYLLIEVRFNFQCMLFIWVHSLVIESYSLLKFP